MSSNKGWRQKDEAGKAERETKRDVAGERGKEERQKSTQRERYPEK